MRSAFLKDIARSVRGSLGRFLAIMGITALGCGFFAGLQMTGTDMRAAGDAFYDGTSLYDIKLVSTLGFSSDDLARVRKVEGIGAAMPAVTCDVMATMGSERIAVRMSSLDVEAAERATVESDYVVTSAEEGYLNRLILREGRWPTAAGECVISADKDYPAGFGVGGVVHVLYGTQDVDDLLITRSFTVVGRVSASYYPYTGSFGSTSLGSGMIEQYLYVSPGSFTEDSPFTELYLEVPSARSLTSGSEAYGAEVGAVKGRLEDRADELGAARLADVKAEAQATLDERRAEYEEQRADAEAQLADARAQLDAAAAEIASGEAEIADGQERLASGWERLADGQASYDQGMADLAAARKEAEKKIADGEAELAANEARLDEAERQLDMTQEDIDAAYAQVADGETQWAEQRAPLAAAAGDLRTCIAALEAVSALASTPGTPTQEQIDATQAQVEAAATAAQALYDSGLIDFGSEEVAFELEALLTDVLGDLSGITIDETTDLESLIEQVRALAPTSIGRVIAAASEAQAQLEEGIAEGDAAVADARAQVDAAQAARDAIDSGRAQLEEGRAELEQGRRDGEAQLAAAQRRLADAKAQLATSRAQLESLEAQLAAARAQLAEGRLEYEDGLADYLAARGEADGKFFDAKAQLADAQREIDELGPPDIYALDRSQNEGAVTYNDDTLRMDSIARVFPAIFFLVAALVSLTTMTRMVEDDRVLIGTYKALGYSKGKIALKYLVYAGIAGTVGAVVGILALSQVLPYIIVFSYGIIYSVPIHAFPMPVDLGVAFLSGGLGVGVTLVATWAAVVSSLREVPATLMLPRAPKAGQRILLERLGIIWGRLSFSWKVTCRNIFRDKRRLAMTVVGISGCTALLLTGFGLHDAIWDIIDCQYGPIVHYDTTVGLDDDAIGLDADRVEDFLDGFDGVGGIVRAQQENMQAGAEGYDGAYVRVSVVIPEDAAAFPSAMTFRDREGGHGIDFGGDSVVVTEKLSMKLGIDVGDEVLVYDQDTVGNAVGGGRALTVTGVAENYVGNLVYVGRDAWKSVNDVPPVFQTLYASSDVGVRAALSAELLSMDDVSTVSFSDETINLYRNMLSVVDLIVVVLIVSAAALAFIVLYNLTNINVSERVREIASLKVLGFTRREVYSYIFREILLLAVVGDALGMVLGTHLASFVVTTAEVDYVMFGRTIHPASYVYAFALTLVFSGIVVLILRRKLDHVDMVESLKSVD